MNSHLLAKCTHDTPLNLWIVRILQCLWSWNTVRLRLWSGILHQYKICSLCLVVITFQFVLCIFAINLRLVFAGSSVKDMFVFITLGTNTGVGLSFHNRSPCSVLARVTFFTHFCDCSVKTELIYRNSCAKQIQSFPGHCNSVLTIFHHFALKHSSGQWTRGSEDWVCFLQLSTSFALQFCPIHLVDCLHS